MCCHVCLVLYSYAPSSPVRLFAEHSHAFPCPLNCFACDQKRVVGSACERTCRSTTIVSPCAASAQCEGIHSPVWLASVRALEVSAPFSAPAAANTANFPSRAFVYPAGLTALSLPETLMYSPLTNLPLLDKRSNSSGRAWTLLQKATTRNTI